MNNLPTISPYSRFNDCGGGIYPSSMQGPKFGMLVPNRIFVGGIAHDTTENELKHFFSTFGNVRDCKVILDRGGLSKSYGFVTFETQEDAENVLKRSGDNLIMKDRKLNIGPAVKKLDKMPDEDKTTSSLVLYNDWNKSWDEWVPETRILKPNETGFQKQKELQQAHQKSKGNKPGGKAAGRGNKKNEKESEVQTPTDDKKKTSEKEKVVEKEKEKDVKDDKPTENKDMSKETAKEIIKDNVPLSELVKKKRNRVSEAAPDTPTTRGSTPASDRPLKKRVKSDTTVESEESFSTKMEGREKIPQELKPWLVDDWDLVTHQKQMNQSSGSVGFRTITAGPGNQTLKKYTLRDKAWNENPWPVTLKSVAATSNYYDMQITTTEDQILVKAPAFYASSEIAIKPYGSLDYFEFGYLQVITEEVASAKYVGQSGEEYLSSSEFPDLNRRRVRYIPDSSDTNKPLYTDKTDMTSVYGPRFKKSKRNIGEGDQPFSKYDWKLEGVKEEHELRSIYGHTKFKMMLVGRKNGRTMRVFCGFRYTVDYHIQVKGMGSKAVITILSGNNPRSPRLMSCKSCKSLLKCRKSLYLPCANASVVILKRMKSGVKAEVIREPMPPGLVFGDNEAKDKYLRAKPRNKNMFKVHDNA